MLLLEGSERCFSCFENGARITRQGLKTDLASRWRTRYIAEYTCIAIARLPLR